MSLLQDECGWMPDRFWKRAHWVAYGAGRTPYLYGNAPLAICGELCLPLVGPDRYERIVKYDVCAECRKAAPVKVGQAPPRGQARYVPMAPPRPNVGSPTVHVQGTRTSGAADSAAGALAPTTAPAAPATGDKRAS